MKYIVHGTQYARFARTQSAHHASRITQYGYTLTELLVVLALLSAVTGVLVMAIYQFYTVTNWGNAQMVVDADLRNAGQWLMRDGNQAYQFTSGVPPIYGTFAITATDDTTVTVTYRYEAAVKTLWRDYRTVSSATSVGVAHRINQFSDVAFVPSGKMVAAQVTSTSRNVSSSAAFTVTLRVR